MSSIALSLLDLEADAKVCLEADDYQKTPGKWCAGCGDFGAVGAGDWLFTGLALL